MAVRVCLSNLLSTDEGLCDLGMFTFITLHLFSTGGRHLSAATDLLCLIERLEELHTKVQGMISSTNLDTTLL